MAAAQGCPLGTVLESSEGPDTGVGPVGSSRFTQGPSVPPGRDLGLYPTGFVTVLLWASPSICSHRASLQCSVHSVGEVRTFLSGAQ